MTLRYRKVSFRLIHILFLLSPIFGTSGVCQTPYQYLFDIESNITMSIEADIEHLIENREIEVLPAQITLSLDDATLRFNGTIEVRGNFRRDANNCDFPPLRLRFEDEEIKNTLLEGNHNLKLVTHCRDRSKEFLQFMAREYTTYKIYNLISPYSLKVKNIDIIYTDKNGKLKPIANQAFLIEDIDCLARQFDMKEFEGKLEDSDVDQDVLLQLSVFQFMIGNTDWIIPLSKNLKFITDGSTYITIPYDFDYTAIVGTDYSLGGRHTILPTPIRKYKGPCPELSDLRTEFSRFEEKRGAIEAFIDQSVLLKPGSKKNMKNYIKEFYDIIHSENQIGRHFQVNCN